MILFTKKPFVFIRMTQWNHCSSVTVTVTVTAIKILKKYSNVTMIVSLSNYNCAIFGVTAKKSYWKAINLFFCSFNVICRLFAKYVTSNIIQSANCFHTTFYRDITDYDHHYTECIRDLEWTLARKANCLLLGRFWPLLKGATYCFWVGCTTWF